MGYPGVAETDWSAHVSKAETSGSPAVVCPGNYDVVQLRYLFLLLIPMETLLTQLFLGLTHWWRRNSFLGGGSKYVIILGANQGGGVMEWKGAREWAIERDSVRNKKRYAAEWGYELEIVDMSTKKRYAHEWRESWEKVDVIRNSMRKYPDAEW